MRGALLSHGQLFSLNYVHETWVMKLGSAAKLPVPAVATLTKPNKT